MGKTIQICEKNEEKVKSKIDLNEEHLKKTEFDNPCVSHTCKNYKSSTRTPVKRKFPGPAGLLPDDCNANTPLSEIFHNDNDQKSNNLVSYLF